MNIRPILYSVATPTLGAAILLGAALLPGAAALRADEGMWLFSNPPVKLLQEKYGFTPGEGWLEHIQKSSVRFNNGGSGSFVGANGLVMTNHHVGANCLAKISTKENDYVANGFEAKSQIAEPKCPDLELNVLMSIEDVTARVNGAILAGMDFAAAEGARRAEMNTIEKESRDKTGLRSDVVTLYGGGQYHLYRYKRYTDVRLVFAPQKAIAFFGGDTDNFEYPRYDLDICFFRVYEKNEALFVEDYLKWSDRGATEGDLVFVSGHPGRTERLDTLDHLQYLRDFSLPDTLNLLRRREVLLEGYSERSSENERRAERALFSTRNRRKLNIGRISGLEDPAFFEKKKQQEMDLRHLVNRDLDLKQKYGDAWDQIAASIETMRKIRNEYNLFGIGPQRQGAAFNSDLFEIAITLVRLAAESSKPNAERLREYAEAGLDSLKLQLFSPAPIYEDMEILQLGDYFGLMTETLGADNAEVKAVLAGKSPHDRAVELVEGTRLKDVDTRKRIAEGGWKAIENSTDPMIELALKIDPAARQIRQTFEQQVEEPQRQAYAKIANAKFALFGASQYPDATSTLRLAFGEVKGYTENGKAIPSATTLGGTYEHAADHGNKPPFELPANWLQQKAQLNLSTPFNFVSTADIIGGNSGSPVMNRAGEIVGIIFDGNIESLVLDYAYTDQQARAVAVHTSGIIEALRKVYNADRLASELTHRR